MYTHEHQLDARPRPIVIGLTLRDAREYIDAHADLADAIPVPVTRPQYLRGLTVPVYATANAKTHITYETAYTLARLMGERLKDTDTTMYPTKGRIGAEGRVA